MSQEVLVALAREVAGDLSKQPRIEAMPRRSWAPRPS